MQKFKINRQGQFSIIAALLVAVVLIAAVMSTYAAIRYSTVEDNPQVLSAVDEINLALRQVVGFTVGYYGSVLQVTGNTSYAKVLASNYLQSGLRNIGDLRPEWGASFAVTTLNLRTDWFSNVSYSSGDLSIKYNLTGIGLTNMAYSASSRLDVKIFESSSSQAFLSITKDGSEPLVNLAKQNLRFYHYLDSASTWELLAPTVDPVVYANGTYVIDLPAGVDLDSYIIKIEDNRGIIVVASSFRSYAASLIRNNTFTSADYVDLNNSDLDSSADKGAQSNFAAQQSAPDSIYDTLTEVNTGGGLLNVTLISGESFEGTWPPTDWSESSSSNWNAENNRAHAGTYSADFDGSGYGASGYLYTPVLDCSNAEAIYVDFWFYDEGCENDEFRLYYYDGANWDPIVQLGAYTENAWVHYQQKITLSEYLVSNFQIRFRAYDVEDGEHAYVDLVTVKKEVDTASYQLDLEEQFTNVNYTDPNQDLCIKAGSLGSENLLVDAWDTNTGLWVNVATLSGLVNDWKNVSISSYLTSSAFTIRFRGSSEGSDSVQDSWQIDSVLLGPQPDISFLLSQQESTIVVEWLQNGTMRFLGQNLEMTSEAKAIPPVSVKALHLNQTIQGVNQEVPFQVEDWASGYKIPLGLTSNFTVFGSSQMVVFLFDNSVSDFTLWWNGSDEAIQTPLAYTNQYFTSDDTDNNRLSNGIIRLQIGSFSVTSTVVSTGTTSSTANFMRINGEESTYGAGAAYVVHHGVVRDIVQQEAEWGTASGGGGAYNCPNLYANIVIILPANATYYTYQLRLMFIDSTRTRTITDICPIRISSTLSSPQVQTENEIASGLPVVATGTGLFSNYTSSGWTAHHWSQLISGTGTSGTGIMFTDDSNQKLYAFDSITGNPTGALSATSTSLIELLPVKLSTVTPFMNAMDIVWRGAVVTFGNTAPIYRDSDGGGLWIIVEYLPTITVTAQS
jgi:hypothetical protein